MKRIFAFLLVCCILCFAGCSKQTSFSGKVLDCVEEENRTVYLIETPQQEKIALLAEENQMIHCWVEGVNPDELAFNEDTGIELFGSCKGFKKSYTTASGEKIPAYTAPWLEVKKVKTPNTLSLGDNTVVEIWKGINSNSYQLPDGTELLREEVFTDPDKVVAKDDTIFEVLTDDVKQKIQAFFYQQGALYDLNTYLNDTYTAYLKSDAEGPFSYWSIQQETVPTAYNDRLVFFSTIVSLPVPKEFYTEVHTESKHSTVFDRATGEPIDTLELFSCNEETLADTLFSLCGITDQNLLEELKAAFDANYIIFYPEYLEVYFPQGSLPSEEHTFILSLEYQQGAADILQSWAVPIAE